MDIKRKPILKFILFYCIAAVFHYTATWIYYGAFQEGHPPYFHIEEFFSAAGCRFLYSLLLTIPIWYIVVNIIYPKSVLIAYLSHLLFLPLFTIGVYQMLAFTKSYFGWVFIWNRTGTVWTIYLIAVFYLLQFVVIHAYQYHQAYKIALQEKAELKQAALQSQVTALKAQLNPHFLHNLFNSINLSIPQENEHTRELIIALSDLFRYQNKASQKDLVLLRDELEFIQNYLNLIKIRLKERLEFEVSVHEELLDAKIPPMILQPLVENAITHGIAPKVGTSKLSIAISKSNAKLHFEIADTGKGIKEGIDFWNKGLGLKNTRLRLKQLYNADLSVLPNTPTGTKVSFVI
ncbi:sensor histidine kinase [Aquimarina brevivitae]|uniref:Histidine kinase n=1 Tax=Aquimarina brevivitae TaxID=323412 RepID=A0A4Q7PG26_9FLAO|nr:histidine kinase [Aquimarina brevivitae]RZS99463.1 histidine kinase [Aquimarina brevivitae]